MQPQLNRGRLHDTRLNWEWIPCPAFIEYKELNLHFAVIKMTIQEVYNKYKHLDHLLNDKEWLCPIGSEINLKNHILYDCWKAIKAEAESEIENL